MIYLNQIKIKSVTETTSDPLFTFVEVPEEEEFAPACRGGADMTKQVDTWIPEHAVKTQHHL